MSGLGTDDLAQNARNLPHKSFVPVKRWQKTAALGAVFGTLSTRLTRAPGRFNLF
jgi:hypothetical protein